MAKNSNIWRGIEKPEVPEGSPRNVLVDNAVELRRAKAAQRITDRRHAALTAANTREKSENQADVLRLSRRSSADIFEKE